VATTLPVGAGLSSSAALEVAVALALGFEGRDLDLAALCQRAEQRASGVPCGVMDQLASVAGVDGHALRIDCTTLEVEPVPLPEEIDVVVVDSGEPRALATSQYAERAAACQAAQSEIGALRSADLTDVGTIHDPVVRRRARHVVTENPRVDAFAAALRAGDRLALGELMAASHASLRDDFEVSTPALDDLVARLASLDGVIGARLTGAGFGGCVVALVDAGTALDVPERSWLVRPSAGARVLR
jgi:galactokinase